MVLFICMLRNIVIWHLCFDVFNKMPDNSKSSLKISKSVFYPLQLGCREIVHVGHGSCCVWFKCNHNHSKFRFVRLPFLSLSNCHKLVVDEFQLSLNHPSFIETQSNWCARHHRCIFDIHSFGSFEICQN